ncbi:MAG TPA: serine hydrolase [Longimicrobium sp.]|jgi:CubicO group peptidase (beta-lactamase class C family)|uniref:serine hydrolase domain-containing protein n=1 Tax=Longimicrobium sp. TaxID=2029185 RepID=UPI002EDA4012
MAKRNSRHPFPRRTAAAVVLAAAVLAVSAAGCTLARTVRYGQPDARDLSMFAHRAMRASATPFRFWKAERQRTDVDTVSVRDPRTGRLVPLSQHLVDVRAHAFLVIRNDTIVYERYAFGHDSAKTSSSFSMAKSATSALVGIALARGEIRALDDSVGVYVPELRGRAYGGVTIRQLLQMSSGTAWGDARGNFLQQATSTEARTYYTPDLRGLLRSVGREEPAGTRWRYKDTDTEVLGWVLASATGRTVAEYMEEVLWKPIGAEHDASWSLDHRGGQEKTSTGWNASARDFAKFGRLFLEGGRWNGRQIVPAEWVAASVGYDPTRSAPEVVTWWGMQHTLYWWHPMVAPQGDFYADGSLGQRIYVQPSTRTIIVQLANSNEQDFPFRKIAAAVNGTTWKYPRGIPGLVLQAHAAGGMDSARATYRSSTAEMAARPEAFTLWPQSLRALAEKLAGDGLAADAAEVLGWCRERFPSDPSCAKPLPEPRRSR